MANTNRVFIHVAANGETKLVSDPGDEQRSLELWRRLLNGGWVRPLRMNDGIVLLCDCDAVLKKLLRNVRVACLLGDVVIAEERVTRARKLVFSGFRPSRARAIIAEMDRAREERNAALIGRTLE